jgi:exopolysaccharide biosynthesis polyprenyl glycosylphosphotransferase
MTPLRREVIVSASPACGPYADFAAAPVADSNVAPAQAGTAPANAASIGSFTYGFKSAIDRAGAMLALLALLPVMLSIALAIRLESPGPALFTQERIGFRERRFRCYKFRSMYHHMADSRAARQATRDDTRVTRFGRFLRRSSLDELPQLLNVLKGDMSLVGPRPHAPETCAAGRMFSEIVPFYDRRHCVRPGITGWAQVNGWRGETRTVEDIEMRVRYDLEYISNWSLLFDLRIMLLTLVRMAHDDTAV